jgi:hypothetical protein
MIEHLTNTTIELIDRYNKIYDSYPLDKKNKALSELIQFINKSVSLSSLIEIRNSKYYYVLGDLLTLILKNIQIDWTAKDIHSIIEIAIFQKDPLIKEEVISIIKEKIASNLWDQVKEQCNLLYKKESELSSEDIAHLSESTQLYLTLLLKSNDQPNTISSIVSEIEPIIYLPETHELILNYYTSGDLHDEAANYIKKNSYLLECYFFQKQYARILNEKGDYLNALEVTSELLYRKDINIPEKGEIQTIQNIILSNILTTQLLEEQQINIYTQILKAVFLKEQKIIIPEGISSLIVNTSLYEVIIYKSILQVISEDGSSNLILNEFKSLLESKDDIRCKLIQDSNSQLTLKDISSIYKSDEYKKICKAWFGFIPQEALFKDGIPIGVDIFDPDEINYNKFRIYSETLIHLIIQSDYRSYDIIPDLFMQDLPHLKSLTLKSLIMKESGVKQIAHHTSMDNLKSLQLDNLEITPPCYYHFFSNSFKSLTILKINYTILNNFDFYYLLNSKFIKRIYELQLVSSISASQLIELLELKDCRMLSLSIQDNLMENFVFPHESNELLNQLEELNLSFTGTEKSFLEYVKIFGGKMRLKRLIIYPKNQEHIEYIKNFNIEKLIPSLQHVEFDDIN